MKMQIGIVLFYDEAVMYTKGLVFTSFTDKTHRTIKKAATETT